MQNLKQTIEQLLSTTNFNIGYAITKLIEASESKSANPLEEALTFIKAEVSARSDKPAPKTRKAKAVTSSPAKKAPETEEEEEDPITTKEEKVVKRTPKASTKPATVKKKKASVKTPEAVAETDIDDFDLDNDDDDDDDDMDDDEI